MTRRSVVFSLSGSLWFVPLVFLAVSIVLAGGLVQLDQWLDERSIARLPDRLSAGPEGARQILSVIASSTIAVAGVIFSITIVTLSLAAAQYSPRVLRSFMRDRLNQVVLGLLVSVFTYSLLVLRSIRSGDEQFVPQLSLWVGILLAVVAIGFFVAFIHNTAVSIQAPDIVARITVETVGALKAVREVSHEDESADIEHDMPSDEELHSLRWRIVPSLKSGYVQDVDVHTLFAIACERNLILRVERPVGEFTTQGRPLVFVNADQDLDQRLMKRIQHQFGIDSYRTIDQDPAFGVRQLVDIAIKALSPSINDTTTAIHCVDYLGVILHHALHDSKLPQTHRQEGKLRLVLEQPELHHFIDLAFNEIRQNAKGNVAILLRMLRLTRQLLEDIDDEEIRKYVKKHIDLIRENIDRDVPSPTDQAVLNQSVRRALDARRV